MVQVLWYNDVGSAVYHRVETLLNSACPKILTEIKILYARQVRFGIILRMESVKRCTLKLSVEQLTNNLKKKSKTNLMIGFKVLCANQKLKCTQFLCAELTEKYRMRQSE